MSDSEKALFKNPSAFELVFEMWTFSGINFDKLFFEGKIEQQVANKPVKLNQLFRDPKLLERLEKAQTIKIEVYDKDTGFMKHILHFKGDGSRTSWFHHENIVYSSVFNVENDKAVNSYATWSVSEPQQGAAVQMKTTDSPAKLWAMVVTAGGSCANSGETRRPLILYSDAASPQNCNNLKTAQKLRILIV